MSTLAPTSPLSYKQYRWDGCDCGATARHALEVLLDHPELHHETCYVRVLARPEEPREKPPLDDEIEICARCHEHVVAYLNRTFDQHGKLLNFGRPYCYHCGSRRPGVKFTLHAERGE